MADAVAVEVAVDVVVAVAVDAAVGESGNTVGHMGLEPTMEENAKHQCRDITLKLRWKTAWVVILKESMHDGVGL